MCIGLNCEPCMCLGGGGEGGEEGKREKRKEKGNWGM